ncbi:RNA methyltransferase [Pontibacter sp. SGAir0037]|nr:RNA methyltransferase [Pontibacter sp. SGAir0037]
MSVTLLWALMLNGQEVVAYSSPAKGSPQKEASKLATAPAEKKAVVKQKVSLEATTSFVALNLHQAVLPTPLPPFAPVKDEALPAYSARAPGAGFIAQLFPITIQPNAP